VAEDMYVTISTTLGDVRVQLFPNHAPKTVANFVELAEGTREWVDPRSGERGKTPLYDGTIFHRVISGFMIQGGDPLGTGTGGPGYRFNDEIHPELGFTKPYLLAMANAGPGTNGSQFFITVAPTTWLTGKHTIFGEVADQASRDVVDAITATETGQMDRPKTDVVVEKIIVERVASCARSTARPRRRRSNTATDTRTPRRACTAFVAIGRSARAA
jgi:peptidyl-prolyl cis-trans isomerase A (cyclophilin A)